MKTKKSKKTASKASAVKKQPLPAARRGKPSKKAPSKPLAKTRSKAKPQPKPKTKRPAPKAKLAKRPLPRKAAKKTAPAKKPAKPVLPKKGKRIIVVKPKAVKLRVVSSKITTKQQLTIKINDNEIWILPQGATDPVLQTLPYDLQEGDTIWCYEPGSTSTEPAVEEFTVDTDPPSEEPVIEYDYNNDELEIDMSVIDVCEEDYDPNATEPYEGVSDDPPIGIGING